MSDEHADTTPLTARELRQSGVLQEVNRLLLHRLGLALSVRWVEEQPGLPDRANDEPARCSVMSSTEPDGWAFGDDEVSAELARNVDRMLACVQLYRGRTFPDWPDGVQPCAPE